MKLIKITDDHYVVVDDSEIKEEDWYVNNNVIFRSDDLFDEGNNPNQNSNNKKITHSTQPLEWFGGEIIFLSEVKELIDVEKKIISPYPMNTQNDVDWCNGYQRGYNQALEDNKDKKYTEEDIYKAYRAGMQFVGEDKGSLGEFIQSLQPKTEWEVEIVDGKLKLM